MEVFPHAQLPVRRSAGLLAALALAAMPSLRAQSLAPTASARTAPATPNSLDAQLGGPARRTSAPGVSLAQWEWSLRHYVRLVGTTEPATLEETVRVDFGNRTQSDVRVTFRAAVPNGFPQGSFQGRKEVSYTIERVYGKLLRHGPRFLAQAVDGPFKLVESDPPGAALADLSTLGGIARGTNMVAAVDEAFRGENLFVLDGEELTFVNQQYLSSTTHAFPAQITLEPVK